MAEQLYKSSDVSYLIHQIGHNVPSMVSASPGVVKPKQSSTTFENLQVLPLSHPALIRYLQDRCIDIEVAKSVCKEVHYEVNNKRYFAIGFPNCGGGYELRIPFFKGCIAPKDISHFYADEPKKICFLFEGFIDFLSFMTLRRIQNPQYNELSNQDYLILNSVTNIHKALKCLSVYNNIQCFLDNDEAGRNAYLQLSKELGDSGVKASALYNGYKDLNDYLCAESKHSEKAEIKKTKGIKF